MTRFRSVSGAMLAALLLVVLAVAPVARLRAAGPTLSVKTVDIQGLSSELNNVEFAFGGSDTVVAPFESSNDAILPPFEGDNHFLYITDSTGATGPYPPYDLTSGNTRLYYPTHLIVRPDSTSASRNFAFVRATAWNPTLPERYRGWEVIARVRVLAGTHKGQVNFEPELTNYYNVEPVDRSADSSVMPTSFGLSAKGQFLVVTNGAQVTTIKVDTGDAYPVQLVPTDQYIPLPDPGPNAATADYHTITDLEVDSNNLVTVLVNSRINGNYSSQLFFYQLVEDPGPLIPGTLTSQAIVHSDQVRAQIAPGSKAATSPDGKLGYFATTDGSLWRVKLSGSGTTEFSLVGNYATSIGAPPAGVEAQPRNVQIDSTGRTITVVRQGAVLNIRRPTYGKHGGGGIRRPTYAKYDEAPGMVILRLDAKGSVAEAGEVPSQLLGSGTKSISNCLFTQDGGAYFASTGDAAGSLIQLYKGDKGWTLASEGDLPPKVGGIVAPDASTIVGIQDFDLNLGDPSPGIIKGGSLVFMSFGSAAGVSSAASRAAIRRPCNVNH